MRRDLVKRRVQIDARPIAVPSRVHAAAHAAARHIVHDDVAPLDDGLVVALPLFEERLAPLLLHLVVRRLLLGALLPDLHPAAAPAAARPDTRGSTSRARTRMWSR